MHAHFRATDGALIRRALVGRAPDVHALAASGDEHAGMLGHLAGCDDCVCSLLQYVEIREVVDYRDYPCFHLAYYAHSPTDKCIESSDGDFCIRIQGSAEESICIGFCPWCGAEFPTSAADSIRVDELGLDEWRNHQPDR